MGVGAWGESAVLRSFEHFREVEGDFLFLEVDEAETAEARGVDYEAGGSFTSFWLTFALLTMWEALLL